MLSIELIKSRARDSIVFVLELLGITDDFLFKVKKFFITFGFNENRQIDFLQDLSMWLSDGCSPQQSCADIIEAGEHDPHLAKEVAAAKDIKKALDSGVNISAGMHYWFSPTIVSLLEAAEGEGSDTLKYVVDEYLKQDEAIKKAKSEFWSPLKAPLLYWGLSGGFMIAMGAIILPKLTKSFNAQDMPESMAFVINVSDFVVNYYFFIAIFIAGVVVISRYLLANNTSKFRMSIDDYFPLNLYKGFAGMRMIKIMGILVESGCNLNVAAKKLEANSNGYLSYQLRFIINKTESGRTSLSDALPPGLFSIRLMLRLKNAMASSDINVKNSALNITANRSGHEVILLLLKTRKYFILFTWIMVVATFLTAVDSLLGVLLLLMNNV